MSAQSEINRTAGKPGAPEGAASSEEALSPLARRALASLALSMLLSSLGISVVNVALPTLAQAFSASFQQAQWIIIAYLLSITTMIIVAGRLGDHLGYRRVLLIGIVLFSVASAFCGAATALWMLIGARTIQGLGAAILMALAVALVRDAVPRERTGTAMGLIGTTHAVGTALGPSVGGLLIASNGWRAIFFVMVPLGTLNFLLARRYLPARGPTLSPGRREFDVLGTLLLALTLAAYALAVTVGRGRFDRSNAALVLVAILAGSLFVRAEARVASPLIPLKAFAKSLLSASLAMNALVSTVMMATLVVGPFYLSRALALDAAGVGMVMSIGPFISVLSGFPAGRIVDRLGSQFMLIAGLTAMAIGALALSLLPAMFGIAGYIAAIAVLTPGYQLFQAANGTAVMVDIDPGQRGVVSGMLSLSRNLGLITGASVMGAVFAYASESTGLAPSGTEAVTTGMRSTFAVATALIVAAASISVLVRPTRRRRLASP